MTDLAPSPTPVQEKVQLSQSELVALSKAWAPKVGNMGGTGQPDQRWYVRLEYNESYEVWLLGWSGTQNTEFHDHGNSSGAVTVVAGEIIESRLRHGGSVVRRSLTPGQTFSFGSSAVHDVQNANKGASLSVHVYSPPLTYQTYYEPDVDGVKPVRTVEVEGPETDAIDLTDRV